MPTRTPTKIVQPAIIRGYSWEGNPVQVFEDEKKEHPLDLTGWLVEWVIGPLTLADGSGLTITRSTGLIVPKLTFAQTAIMPGVLGESVLRVQDESVSKEPKIAVGVCTIEVVGV